MIQCQCYINLVLICMQIEYLTHSWYGVFRSEDLGQGSTKRQTRQKLGFLISPQGAVGWLYGTESAKKRKEIAIFTVQGNQENILLSAVFPSIIRKALTSKDPHNISVKVETTYTYPHDIEYNQDSGSITDRGGGGAIKANRPQVVLSLRMMWDDIYHCEPFADPFARLVLTRLQQQMIRIRIQGRCWCV